MRGVSCSLFFGLVGLSIAAAAACSSSEGKHAQDGAAGEGAAAGSSDGAAGSPSDSGGSNANGEGGGAAESSGVPGSAGVSSVAGADGGGADAGGAGGSGGFVPEPVLIDSYGCFFSSGDAGDILSSGAPATVLVSSPYGAGCEGEWVSDNDSAHAPMQPPTTIRFERAFIIDPSIANGSFKISFKADDAISFVLNGEAIGECAPTANNPGECQQSCKTQLLDSDILRGDGETNTLEIQLINLQSVPLPGDVWGYTALSYSVCVTPPS